MSFTELSAAARRNLFVDLFYLVQIYQLLFVILNCIIILDCNFVKFNRKSVKIFPFSVILDYNRVKICNKQEIRINSKNG